MRGHDIFILPAHLSISSANVRGSVLKLANVVRTMAAVAAVAASIAS
jgi:hypothetical protein